MLPYGKQSLSKEDIQAVVDVLRSDFLTCGPQVELFEQEFAAFVGAKHAVAVNSATSALHLAMKVLDIGPGDRVVTSPNTFVASANCAAFVGAIPDFSDIDPQTYNLAPDSLEASWKPDTKAVVAVDYSGFPCNMPEISRIAREKGAYIIEDGCHATGGGFTVDGKTYKIGGHPWADITTFSFHPVKTMTTGEGGMLVTDNDEWAAKARLLRSHGITRAPADFVGLGVEDQASSDERSHSSAIDSRLVAFPLSQISAFKSQVSALVERGPWYYEMRELGYNYRITDIQCALGRSQLRRLPEFIRRRQEIVTQYNLAFADIPWLTTPKVSAYSPQLSAFSFQLSNLSLHLYTVMIDFEAIGKSRTQVMAELHEKGVGTQVLYIPVHLQPWYRKTYGYKVGKCPNAEAYYSKCLSLPLYPALSDADATTIIAACKSLHA
jgi:perosamine synthetase